ncbi:MAG: DEAD/DEAH box helicase [Sphingomonadaceae bacterium]
MVEAIASFSELNLRPETLAALEGMGISVPTPIQQEAIPPLLQGLDVVGQARTGSGKTLAFGLPIVERCDPTIRGIQALVLTPTRELAIQVAEVLDRLAQARRMWLTLVYGGRPLEPEREALMNGAQIVVGTPGRVLDHLWQGNLLPQHLRIFVLDEGDEMLDRGFAPEVEKILWLMPEERQTALFSATLPEWITSTIKRHLRNPVTVRVDGNCEAPPEIEQVVFELDPRAKLSALCTLLDHRGDGPVLVFGRTKIGVERLAADLRRLGYPVAALQGNMSQESRERVMDSFRSGRVQILLATNVAARGLDVEGIEGVINYELPESAELFTHRSGRTGRMGREGVTITLLTPEDAPKWRQIELALGRRLPRRPWPGGEPATSIDESMEQAAARSERTSRQRREARGGARARGDRRPVRRRPEAGTAS